VSRVLGAAALVAAALVAARVWSRRSAAPEPEPETEPQAPQGREWRCECGQEYVVSGVDRHRVYRPAGDTPGEPLLEARCTNCGAALPATREMAEAERA
jgi:hypothetical protein